MEGGRRDRVLLIVLSLGGVADVVRRFILGAQPLGPARIVMAFVAAVNALCLQLLARHRREDVNLRAAWTFSVADFLSTSAPPRACWCTCSAGTGPI